MSGGGAAGQRLRRRPTLAAGERSTTGTGRDGAARRRRGGGAHTPALSLCSALPSLGTSYMGQTGGWDGGGGDGSGGGGGGQVPSETVAPVRCQSSHGLMVELGR